MYVKWAVILSILLILLPAAVAAEEEEELQLTINEAVERALMVNKELERAELEKDQAWEDRKDAADMLRDRYGDLTPEVEREIDITHTEAMITEIDYQIKSREKEAVEEDVKAQAVENYCAVLSAQERVREEELRLEKAQWEYEAAQTRRDLGLLSAPEMTAASRELARQKTALEEAKKELEKSYTELNVLIGLWPERRPALTTQIHYRPLEVRSIVGEANRAVDNSHELDNATRYAQLNRLEMRQRRHMEPMLTPYDRDRHETDREIAELEEDEAEQELKKQVRLMIYDIKSLEDVIDSAKEDVGAAEEMLKTAESQYEVGLGSKGDLLEAEEALFSARAALTEFKYNHAIITAAYRNLTGRSIVPASWSK